MKGYVNVEAEITKQEFERRVLIELAANDDTPADILSSIFDDVRVSDEEIAVMRAMVDLNYTCSIGYDKLGRYYNKWSETYENRTLTDWQPFSGNTSGKVNAAVRVGETDIEQARKEEEELRLLIDSTKKESRHSYESDELEISEQTESVLKKMCMGNCFKKVSLPGDSQRDISYKGNIEVESRAIWKLPKYSVDYAYGGESYSASGMAAGDVKLNMTTPNGGDKRDKGIVKKYILLLILGALTWVADYILYAVAVIDGVASAAIFIAGVGFFGVYAYLYFKEKKQRINSCKAKKLSELEKLLSAKNLEPLTAEERNAILKSSDDKKEDNNGDKDNKVKEM